MALIAVALLMAGSFYCVIYAEIEKSSDNIESISSEFAAVEDENERVKLIIESGLGQIITDISTSPTSGNLIERSKSFEGRAEKLLESNFPTTCKGVKTEILDSDIRLTAETLKTEGDAFSSDSRLAYLKAVGEVEVRHISDSTVTTDVLEISADATSGLPLLLDCATRFELSTTGNNSALTQMMEYQLTALGQERIAQGFGMTSAGGKTGTTAIITEADVKRAYDHSITILQSMLFNSNGNNDSRFLNGGHVDIAELVTLDDGCITVNIGSLYSQSILSGIDEYVVQWMDYLCLDLGFTVIDTLNDWEIEAYEAITTFFTGEDGNTEKLRKHITNKMKSIGMSEDEYRYFMNGESIQISVPDITVTERIDDELIEIEVSGKTLDVYYPDVDILRWNGWDGFFGDYHGSRNQFKESLKILLSQVALELRDDCMVSVPVDPFDSSSFSDSFTKAVEDAITEYDVLVKNKTKEIIGNSKVSDPLICAVYDRIQEKSYSIFGVDELEKSIRNAVDSHITQNIEDQGYPNRNITYHSNVFDIESYISDYRAMVDRHVQSLIKMTDAEDESNDVLVKMLSFSSSGLIDLLGLEDNILDRILEISEETSNVLGMNPYSDLVCLPDSDVFKLIDENGVVFTEKFTITDNSKLDIRVNSPIENKSRNIHHVGFGKDTASAYSSVFSIDVEGSLTYSVTGTNPVYEILGMSDSEYSNKITLDFNLNIACISAWALAGTSYTASNTLYSDAWNSLIELLEPLMEPLRTMFASIEKLCNLCTTAIVEFATYLSELITQIYETLQIPLTYLQEVLNGYLSSAVEGLALTAMNLGLGSQSITLEYYGFKIILAMNAASLVKSSKDIIKVSMEKVFENGLKVLAAIQVKYSDASGYHIIVSGEATGKDWGIGVSIDPLMKTRPYFVNVNGFIRDIGMEGMIPKLVQYNEISVAASDIPAVSSILSNIPLPIAGAKGSVDVGFELKYDLPMKLGLMINEVELNPAGDDNGREWVELYNNSGNTINLKDYRLVPGSNERKTLTLPDMDILPLERLVIVFDKQSLNNSKSSGKSGERVSLISPDGVEIDTTPWFTDTDNSNFSWQRVADGVEKWSYIQGTPGTTNGGYVPGGYALRTLILGYIKDAGIEAFNEIGGNITSVDALGEYIQTVVSKVMDNIIESTSGILVEANAYIEVKITDYAETQHAGIRVMVGLDSDIVEAGLRYILSMIPTLEKYIENPEGMTVERIAYEGIYLKTIVFTAISAPEFLGTSDLRIEAGLSVKINLAAVSNMLGEYKGKWNAEIGIMLEDIPNALVPSAMEAKSDMNSDLWLMCVNFFEL